MDFLRRFAPCGCIKQQSVGENGEIKDNMTISIKTTCCRRTKIINYNIDIEHSDDLNDIKKIIEKMEEKVKSRRDSLINTK
jgi:hypothetical protein